MILDFFVQLFIASVFFLGILLGGLSFFLWIGYETKNSLLKASLAYFTSLCIYLSGLVAVLLILNDKRIAAIAYTVAYGIFSAIYFFGRQRKAFKAIIPTIDHFKNNKLFILIFVFTLFSFWLQIYNTSLLDEWLHRPITKEFIQYKQFPLINPLDRGASYIYSYHYGPQLLSGVIGLMGVVDASISLDIFKLASAIASLLLLYGIIFAITKDKKWSVFGMVSIFFLASSFFLLDSFATSHLKNFSGWNLPKGQRWPLNVPLSFDLTGITWINIPLMLAWVYFLDDFKRKFVFNQRFFLWSSLVFIGFFLISELFAVFGLLALALAVVIQLLQKKASLRHVFLGACLYILILGGGIYFTGGVVGGILQNSQAFFSQYSESGTAASGEDSEGTTTDISAEESQISSKQILELKSPMGWGYPTETRTLTFINYPLYYLRTFLLEGIICIFLGWLVFQKRITFKNYEVTVTTSALALALPFFFHTSFGDLNFFKLAVYGLLVLHIGAFLILREFPSKLVRFGLVTMLVFGSISGMFLGANTQWKFLSSGKGKMLYCSQNPLCYSGQSTALLTELSQLNPSSVKSILVTREDAIKVLDLTSFRVVILPTKDSSLSQLESVDYIFNSPDFRKGKDQVFLEKVDSYEKILEKGEYSILHIK